MSKKDLHVTGNGSSNKKEKRSLSKRQKSIIRTLVQMKGRPVTVAAISEKLAVSNRTVLRELPFVEKWLDENDFHFIKKRGTGLAIVEDLETYGLLEELLYIENEAVLYSKDERRGRILGTLFFAVSPAKAYSFTSKYDISEGTLYSDLDVLDKWLEDYNIKINRRPGLGIFMTGDEASRRQAIVNAVFEFFDVNRMPILIDNYEEEYDKKTWLNHPLIPFFTEEIIQFARRACKYCEKSLNVTYVDNSRISLVNRISLAVYRMQHDRYLRTMPESVNHVINSKEYSLARELASMISSEFDLEVTEEEIAHITTYLLTLRVVTPSLSLDDPLKAINVRYIVLSMVGVVEQLTGIPFRSDAVMIDDLAEHITLMQKRISLDLIAGNTQSAVIKENYPSIYTAVETACQVLREWIYPKDLKESDIGFIAMHFAAAAERLQKNARKVAVVVVCPVGVASSRMLAASLVKSFPEIEIRHISSAFSINEGQLREEGIDLIISTAEIRTDFPHLCVNKVLQVQDKMMVKNALNEVNRGHLQDRINRKTGSHSNLSMDNIRTLSALGTEIVELTEHFRIVPVEKVDSVDGLIEIAAASLADSGRLQQKLMEGFRSREQISDTYVKEMEICLLHCKTDAMHHSRFIYIALQQPLAGDKGSIRGAVVMTVPALAEDEILLEPAGRLSSLLVEDDRFLQALFERDTTAGITYIEKALVKYYQHEVTKIMEV